MEPEAPITNEQLSKAVCRQILSLPQSTNGQRIEPVRQRIISLTPFGRVGNSRMRRIGEMNDVSLSTAPEELPHYISLATDGTMWYGETPVYYAWFSMEHVKAIDQPMTKDGRFLWSSNTPVVVTSYRQLPDMKFVNVTSAGSKWKERDMGYNWPDKQFVGFVVSPE